MSKIKLLSKISLQYWRCHGARFLTLALSVMLGAAALCSTALLLRSEKNLVLEEEFDALGNYDIIMYEMDASMEQTLGELPEVERIGFYYELGYGGVPGAESAYKTAAYGDEQSRELYHMSCSRGRYPEAEHEVAIDSSTASALGIAPYPGETIRLSLYDRNRQVIGEQEFLVSGIYDVVQEGNQYGYKRYYQEMEDIGYEVPLIIMSPAMNDRYDSQVITAYVQAADELDGYTAIREAVGGDAPWSAVVISMGRQFSYEYILGAGEAVSYRYGGLNLQNLQQAIRDGNVFRDFYSSILIPVISGLILIVIVLALTSFLRSLVKDRLEQIAILRLQGMRAIGGGAFLMIDLLVWVAVFTLVGLAVGCGLHVLLISTVNAFLDLRLSFGFVCNEYVRAVTVNPYGYGAGVMAVCTIPAVLLSVRQVVGRTPILLLQETHRRKGAGRVSGRKREPDWKILSNQALMLHDPSVLFLVIILMGTAFFGYTYFRALADKNNSELNAVLEERELGQWDYVAEKPESIDRFGTNAESRHDCGLEPETFRRLLQQDGVTDSYSMIVNASTRLTYPQGTEDAAVLELLSDSSIRQFTPSEEEYANACYESELAVLQAMGYSTEEAVYEVPTVGLPWKQMEALESCLAAGALNREKLAAGEEVVVAVTAENREAALKAFPIGSSLPLSDILLSEEEEACSFGAGRQALKFEPVYAKDVMMPPMMEGEEAVLVNLKAYAFGSRVDIDTKVGAVLVIEDPEMLQRCMVEKSDVYPGGEKEYGVNLLCLEDVFAAWGLPDRRYTKAGIMAEDSFAMEELEWDWYRMIAQGNGMHSYSTLNIRADMDAGSNRVMCIYYAVMFMLILVAMCAIGMQLYASIRRRSMDIAYMRAVGMSMSQLARVILRQNIFYPIIGAVCAMIPAALCQCFFFYIRQNLGGSVFVIAADERLPWWLSIPYRYNLFAYHPILTLLLLFCLVVLLMGVVTIPQLVYIRRMQVVEDLEKVTF